MINIAEDHRVSSLSFKCILLNVLDFHWILYYTVLASTMDLSLNKFNMKDIPCVSLLYDILFFFSDLLNHHRGRKGYTNPLIDQVFLCISKWYSLATEIFTIFSFIGKKKNKLT
ncbi:hypothetical protein H8356DRAFT_1423550 [Neocallimastix lanati (nom. inval.)]|nr:hypothetical protein H8356DRAFT_1423550 [Neocallimastix sp. JGI-2020a]